MRMIRFVLAAVALGGLAACSDATGSGPVPASLEYVSGGGQEVLASGALAEPLRVRVLDRDGDPVEGVTVQWSASAGTLSAPEAVTGADGVASTNWVLTGPLGRHTAFANVGRLPAMTYDGFARRGITFKNITVGPAQVNVASGAATVEVTVQASSDWGDVTVGTFYFFHGAGQRTVNGALARTGGTATDGTWKGTVEVPQGAQPGPWMLQALLRTTRMEVTTWREGAMTVAAN